jgi:hypothetical protein
MPELGFALAQGEVDIMARMRRLPWWIGLNGVLLVVMMACIATAAELPKTITDKEFWALVSGLSEKGGVFSLQVMSNEDSAQFVIPMLKQSTAKGGVFIGVGSEQNFTYIAATQPALAFVLDIRRDNMIEHLMYKALFEISADRADLVSKLFARQRPAGLDANSSVRALFEAYQSVPVDEAYYGENLKTVIDRLEKTHGFPLTDTDKTDVGRMMNAFRTAGPNSLKGFGDSTNPTYAQLMAATDLAGEQQSYLATEANFRIVKELERQNLIVPLVGDFAGEKAIAGIGQYLKEHAAVAHVFYVSNVERYLWEQGDHGKQFYANVAKLPLDSASIFVRAVTSDISVRLGIPIPASTAKWRTFLFSINDCLQGVTSGRIQGYRDLFVGAK